MMMRAALPHLGHKALLSARCIIQALHLHPVAEADFMQPHQSCRGCSSSGCSSSGGGLGTSRRWHIGLNAPPVLCGPAFAALAPLATAAGLHEVPQGGGAREGAGRGVGQTHGPTAAAADRAHQRDVHALLLGQCRPQALRHFGWRCCGPGEDGRGGEGRGGGWSRCRHHVGLCLSDVKLIQPGSRGTRVCPEAGLGCPEVWPRCMRQCT